jgi:serine protease Do
MDQIAPKRFRMFFTILILSSCFSMLAMPTFSGATVVHGKVTSIKEDMIELDIGSDKGLSEGDKGRVYFTAKVSGEPNPLPVYVAHFKVTFISKNASMAKIEKTSGEIKVGYLVEVTVRGVSQKPLIKEKKQEKVIYRNINQLVTLKKPTVVTVNMKFGDESFKKFFGDRLPDYLQPRSGLIIERNGYVLTSSRIISFAREIKVKLSDGKIYDAQVVGQDPYTYLALIKIKLDRTIPVCRLGDSDKLEIGEIVIPINYSSPLDDFFQEHPYDTATIKAKRVINNYSPYGGLLQIDLSRNLATTGTPIFNLKGEVVGIITIILEERGEFFAVPINTVKRIIPQLKRGRVSHGNLGVYIKDMTPELAHTLGLLEPKGILIYDVSPVSPAYKGGMKKDDVVLDYDGHKLENTTQLQKVVRSTPVGKKVEIVVLRNKQRKTLWVTIGEIPERQVTTTAPRPERWDFTVQAITPAIVDQLGLPDDTGVVITQVEPNSPAQKEGLQREDVIIEVEHNQVKNLADFRKYMELYKERKTLLLTVRVKANNYRSLFVVLKRGE